MRAMWSAASGMKSLQAQIDTISNNLANVNTTGFKKQRMEFEDILYQRMANSNFNQGEGRPVSIELGNGVMSVATTRSFDMGTPIKSGNELDVCIVGDGFISVKDLEGRIRYTKDGSLKLSVNEDSTKLVSSNGDFVQGDGGDIELGANVATVGISKTGEITVTRKETPDNKEAVGKIKLSRFANPAGLDAVGQNRFMESAASGKPVDAEGAENGEIWQGFLESSNVQVADEMVNMITAQRAYEMNVKTIQTADRILELSNEVKR